MTTHRVDRLRIRPGPGAATRAGRLARIAHTHLGRELDRALDGVAGPLVVDQVVVRFPMDPSELDDDALAMLWAALIRDAVNATPAANRSAPPDHVDTEPNSADSPSGDVVALAAVLLAWAESAVLPPELVLVRLRSSAPLLDEVIGLLPALWRQAALDMVAGSQKIMPAAVAAEDPAAPASDAPTPGPPGENPSGTSTSSQPATRAGSTTASPPSPPTERSTTPPVSTPPVSTPPRPASTSLSPASASPGTAQPDPGMPAVPVSAYGGLVLLYVRLRPVLDQEIPLDTRLAILALVADEDPDLALADPLVRLLAGDPDWQAPRVAAPVRLDPAVEDTADGVLRAFARDLPGFGRSTPGFVRDQWVRRAAVMLDDGPDVLLRLGRRPLDLVLDRLPYPVGVFRFPWTPTLVVGWEAS